MKNYQMIPDWIGCPICQGPLEERATQLYCPVDGSTFPVQGGILRLLPRKQREKAAQFSSDYRHRREEQGWRSLSVTELVDLPDRSPSGWDSLYWPVRRQSFRVLTQWVERTADQAARSLRVMDMGAGIGWLAGRLANRGHEVVALDISCDTAFGLGAAVPLQGQLDRPLTLVQGSFEQPPLRVGRVDSLIYNASLHYAKDVADCLATAARALRQGGSIVIMDSPIVDSTRLERHNGWIGGRLLSESELYKALANAGLVAELQPVRRGLRWRLRQVRTRLNGGVPFKLPIVVATK